MLNTELSKLKTTHLCCSNKKKDHRLRVFIVGCLAFMKLNIIFGLPRTTNNGTNEEACDRLANDDIKRPSGYVNNNLKIYDVR